MRYMVSLDNSDFEKRFLLGLNPQQRDAVLATDGSVLLLATPGSGKTTVLVTRLGYMICRQGIDPASILTMTYTRAATADMRRRFTGFFGEEVAANLQFRTINGVSSKIIEYYSNTVSRQSSFSLQENEGELNSLIRQLYQQVNNNEYPDDSVVKDIRTGITYVKNMMLTDEEINSRDNGINKFPEIYRLYQAELKSRRQMDYDDQMIYAHAILRKHAAVLEHFQDLFRYICVDEAQDTSKIQHEIIKLLASKSGNLFMVGDEDQSIYGFRAAYPDALMSFESDHPGARVLLMEENYRSTPEIVDLANRFVAKNENRREKTIKATRSHGVPVSIVQCPDRESQYDVLLEIARTCDRETAILFRNNECALPLIDLFEKNGVLYNRKKQDDLFFTYKVVTDIQDILRFAFDPLNVDLFMKIYYKFSIPISKKAASEACRRSAKRGKPILKELLSVPDIKGITKDSVIDLMNDMVKIRDDTAPVALRRVWESMHYSSFVEQRSLDKGKYFILCMLARDSGSVQSFQEKLDSLKDTAASHQNSDDAKVILSTIHSSKGLEYDRVFLLDIIDGILPSLTKDMLETPDEKKNYEEERRLYYVAMTRAKNELCLFRFNSDSSFVSESAAALPKPVSDKNGVFSSLSLPLLGKTYIDKEWGSGVLEAQCGDDCFIRFTDGSLRYLSLSDMMRRRSISYEQPQEQPMKAKKKSKNGTNTQNSIQNASALRVGIRVSHKYFGDGIVSNIGGGKVKIRFDSHGTKEFLLENCIERGFLAVVD